MANPTKARLDWKPILARAAVIVNGYSIGVTLRQLFYRLVSEGLIPNTTGAYKGLSKVTAEARRAGTFPALFDRGRNIERPTSFDSPEEALEVIRRIYRRDRTDGQPFDIYLGVEKNALAGLLTDWFSDLGLPVVALGGYASQTLVDDVGADIVDRITRAANADPDANATATMSRAVLIYGGDFDPSGEDIDRDFIKRVGSFAQVERVALSAAQVTAYGLPPAMGKVKDSRSGAFTARHGALVQVELDALPPTTLRDLYQQAIDRYWDTSAYDAALAQEEEDRETLSED